MKINLLIQVFLIAVLITPAQLFYAQVNSAARTKLFTISEGEEPVYSECRLYLTSSGNSVSLVTKDANGKYYVYENSKKSSPFAEIKEIEQKAMDENDILNSSVYNSDRETNQEGILTYNDEGKMVINSGGKTYGPFQMVLNIITGDDGKLTAAVTLDNMKASLLTQNGALISLPGMPSYTSISPSGKKVIIVSVKEYNPSEEFTNIDMSKLTPEDMLKLSKQIEEKQKNAPPPEAYIYMNDGKKLGPYPKDALYGNNPAFCITGGENWMMTLENKLYVNGTLLAELGSEGVSIDDIWISSDGQRFVIITYDKITFSDGSSFKFPLLVTKAQKDNKTILNWIGLENEKDVVLYSKPL